MRETVFYRQGLLFLVLCLLIATAQAEPGDAVAVAKARKDYAAAMKGHDMGLQNAMRTELTFQLQQSKERAAKKGRKDSNAPSAS